MNEYIRGYHMFLPRAWVKWCVYLLYPLLVSGGLYALYHKLGFYYFICVGFAGCAIVGVELMLDGQVFAGIASKRNCYLEYLKTSVKGMPVLKKALITDAVRRFCSIAVILFSLYPMVVNQGKEQGGRVILAMTAYVFFMDLLVEAGVLILRFFSNVNLILAAIYVIGMLAFMAGICIQYPVRIWQMLLVAAGAIAVGIAGRKWILKRVRDSFYDNRMEKMRKAD